MKYQVICADLPWSFNDSLSMSDVKRGAIANYKTLSQKDLLDLKVKDIADPDGCVLVLWVPSTLLESGLEVLKKWGFQHKQTYVWVKTKKEPLEEIVNNVKSHIKSLSTLDNVKKTFKELSFKNIFDINLSSMLGFGMGHLFRQSHEIALIGINNNKIYKQLENRSQRSVCLADNKRHSQKPDNLQDSLDLMFPKADKIELFGRKIRTTGKWTVIGNEVCSGEDIRVSLEKVINLKV